MKRSTGIAALVAALACGDSRPLVPCSSDAECKAGRKCVEGYCESGEEVVGDDSAVEKPCGNSPLVGKYLWGVDTCDYGMKTQITDDCKGTIVTEPTDSNSDGITMMFRVEGNNLLDFTVEGTRYQKIFNATLVKEISRSDLPAEGDECWVSNPRYEQMNCVLNGNRDLYGLLTNGRVCATQFFVLLKNTPWPGEESCLEQMESVRAGMSQCGYDPFY